MKIISKIFFVVILLGIIFLNTTCGKQSSFKDVTWEGHVYDSSGAPYKGMIVTLEGCSGGDEKALNECLSSFTIGNSTTDASGHFYIHGKASSADLYSPGISGPWAPIWDQIKPVNESALKTSRYTEIHLPYK